MYVRGCEIEGMLDNEGKVIEEGKIISLQKSQMPRKGAQWLSGIVLDLRPRNCGFEPHRRHCVVSLSKTH